MASAFACIASSPVPHRMVVARSSELLPSVHVKTRFPPRTDRDSCSSLRVDLLIPPSRFLIRSSPIILNSLAGVVSSSNMDEKQADGLDSFETSTVQTPATAVSRRVESGEGLPLSTGSKELPSQTSIVSCPNPFHANTGRSSSILGKDHVLFKKRSASVREKINRN